MGKTDAERKQAQRDIRRKSGMKRLEAWLYPLEFAAAKRFIDRLVKRREKK